MKTDERDIPLDQFEQEMLARLMRAHAAQPEISRGGPRSQAATIRRPRWRGSAYAALAIALIATSGALAAVSLLSGSTSPVRLYGGKDLCPINYEVAAQVSTKLFYPSNYPGDGFSEGDVRCFASAQYARQAGYRKAPTPSGYTQVGQIYFARTPVVVSRTCATAAREVRAVIYCPTMLPTPWIHPLINWDCPTYNCGVPLLSLSGSFAATSAYSGSDPGEGQATFWSATAGQQRAFPYVLWECDAPRRVLARTRFRGHPATWYRCSIFGNASTALRWQIGRETYQISADGPAQLSQTLVKYIAGHLRVEPRARP